jgi:hypothetical protein
MRLRYARVRTLARHPQRSTTGRKRPPARSTDASGSSMPHRLLVGGQWLECCRMRASRGRRVRSNMPWHDQPAPGCPTFASIHTADCGSVAAGRSRRRAASNPEPGRTWRREAARQDTRHRQPPGCQGAFELPRSRYARSGVEQCPGRRDSLKPIRSRSSRQAVPWTWRVACGPRLVSCVPRRTASGLGLERPPTIMVIAAAYA